MIYDKSKSKETITQLQTQYSNVDSARNEIQEEYNDALARMDSLTGSNTQLAGQLSDRQKQLEQMKANIKSELSKKNADISKLKAMINDFKGQVDNLYVTIDSLKAANQELTVTNQKVTAERDTIAAQKTVVEQNLATTQEEKSEIINRHKPNIILIMGDDIGYEVPTCNGGQSYETPNIDWMAKNGMRFTQCHSSPFCAPSRWMLLTGKYNFRNFDHYGILGTDQRTIANMLHDNGYTIAVYG